MLVDKKAGKATLSLNKKLKVGLGKSMVTAVLATATTMATTLCMISSTRKSQVNRGIWLAPLAMVRMVTWKSLNKT
jgi:hypothetical protein